MTAKSLVMVAALGLSSMGLASAKSNEIILKHKMMVDNTTLQPGTYRVSANGSDAIFQKRFSSRSYTLPATVTDNDRPFAKVVVHTSKTGKIRRINEVDLGGSATRLQFQ